MCVPVLYVVVCMIHRSSTVAVPVSPVVEVSGRPSAMFAEAVLQADEASVL